MIKLSPLRAILAIFLIIALAFQGRGQRYIDSLHNALHYATNDSSRVILLTEIAAYFEYSGQDSNEYYVDEARKLAGKLDFRKGIFLANRSLFFAINLRANY